MNSRAGTTDQARSVLLVVLRTGEPVPRDICRDISATKHATRPHHAYELSAHV